MRWLCCVIALLMIPACDDDSTGPGSDFVVRWRELSVPAEIGEGTVVALATGGGRVVALVHSMNGEWVIEETPTGWVPVLSKPLPFPPREPATPRVVLYLNGSQDLVVSDEGRIYVVGADESPGAPYGDAIRTPAVWAEGETDWTLTTGTEDAGILLEAEWVEGIGIEAIGIGIRNADLLHLRGTPETGLSWSSIDSPSPDRDDYIADMVLEDGSMYVGGSHLVEEPQYSFQPLLWQASGTTITRLEGPCGECEGLAIGPVASSGGTLYWGGMLVGEGPPAPTREVTGWLATYDPGSRVWTEIQLPPEIRRVTDILIHGTATFLAVETQSGENAIYRSGGRTFLRESSPDDGFVYWLVGTDDQRVIGAGSWARFPERGDPLLVERVQELR